MSLFDLRAVTHFAVANFAQWVIYAWCAIGLLQLVFKQIPLILLHESVGYGDSFILLSVQEFRRTGILYPPIGPDHLTPVLYSPLLYLTHFVALVALPSSINPYLGPRLLELFWFVACVAVTGALTRRIIHLRSAFWLGVLLAASYSFVVPWVLQLRADFPGITCSLLSLWFLTSRGRRSALFAGICAGMALQFKLVYVAAAVTGGLWLLIYKRWAHFAEFAVAVGTFSLGLYAVFAWHEPEMLRQILIMRKMIPHLPGVFAFYRQLAGEPGVLLAAAGILSTLASLAIRRRPRMLLIMIFVVVSLASATYASLQFGAYIYYFNETILAATPFAVLALLRLRTTSYTTSNLLIGLLLLGICVLPSVSVGSSHSLRGMRGTLKEVSQRNLDYENLRRVLSGAKIVSSIPDVTILTPDHVIAEPYLLTALSITQGADLSGVRTAIVGGYFDAIATQPADYLWRGVPQLERTLHRAVTDSYTPFCLYHGILFHLNREHPSLYLASKLRGIGCEVTQCGPGTKCPGLGVAIDAFHPFSD